MAPAQRTRDHEEIRRWVEERGGHPAFVQGTEHMLGIDFGTPEENLEKVDWNRFFEHFDRSQLAFLYSSEPGSRFNKFVNE